jgi:hypothetical protein
MKRLFAAAALLLLPAASQAAPAPRPLTHGEGVILTEWRKAANRRACAPIGFTGAASGGGQPRRAYFGGGWAAAFDRAGLRSAFGVAGVGLLPGDGDPFERRRAELAAQWPYGRELPRLGRRAYAGYGIEGAKPLSETDGDGRGLPLLAYVRVPGQRCLYNVWSKLGRRHLEGLLDDLRPVPVRPPPVRPLRVSR